MGHILVSCCIYFFPDFILIFDDKVNIYAANNYAYPFLNFTNTKT